jgi:hypothetical protein
MRRFADQDEARVAHQLEQLVEVRRLAGEWLDVRAHDAGDRGIVGHGRRAIRGDP